MTLLSLRKILTQKMPTSMSPYFLLYVTTAATAMHFQVAKQILCWRFSVFAGENIEISNLGAVETSVSRASAILGNFLTPRLNPSWPPLFYPSTFLTTTFVCHLRAIAKHQKRDGFCHHCDTSVQSEFLLLATLAQYFFPHLDPDLLVVCASSRSRVPLVLWEILGFFWGYDTAQRHWHRIVICSEA